MDKTKINYRKGGNGIRTSITLSTALIDTWLVAKGLDDEDLDFMIDQPQELSLEIVGMNLISHINMLKPKTAAV